MGSNQSHTTRVTIENLEKDSMDMVYVSDEVVRRLTEGWGLGGSESTTASPRRVSVEGSGAGDGDLATMSSALSEQESLSRRLRKDLTRAAKREQELEQRLRDVTMEARAGGAQTGSAEYRRKMAQLEARQQELQSAMKTKFQATVKEVSDKFFSQQPETACADLESKVMQCLLDNQKQPLKCSDLADEFSKCVADTRAHLLGRKG